MAYHGTSDEDSRLSRMLQEQERRWEQSRFRTMDDLVTQYEVKQGALETGGMCYCLADAIQAAKYQLARVRWDDETTAYVNRVITDLQLLREELKATKLREKVFTNQEKPS